MTATCKAWKAMNLKELAAHLGLSQTTVSRALNGYPEVNEATRRRVAAAAEQHNYRPNTRAKSLATGRAMAVGHVIPTSARHEMVNPIFGDFISGAGETYATHGYDMVLSMVEDVDQARAYRDLKSKGTVDGLIIHGPSVADGRIALLRELGLPFVVHGRASEVVPEREPTDTIADLDEQTVGDRGVSEPGRRLGSLLGDLGDELEIEGRPAQRRELEERSGGTGQRGAPTVNRLAQRDRCLGRGERPHRIIGVDRSEQLGGEVRVAPGPSMHLVGARSSSIAEDPDHELGHRLGAEVIALDDVRAERTADRRERGRRRGGQLPPAHRGEDRHPGCGRAERDADEQLPHSLVGPVGVVEHHEERASGGEPVQQADDRREELEAGDIVGGGLGRDEGPGHPRHEIAKDLGVVPDQLGNDRGIEELEALAEGGEQRQQPNRSGNGVEAHPERLDPGRRIGQRRLDESSLPDARVTGAEGESALPGHGAVDDGSEDG